MLLALLLAAAPAESLVCDFSSPAALRWARWRDFDLHAQHEDKAGGFCESHRLWPTTMMGVEYRAGEGLAVLKAGTGTYADRTCRPWREADGAMVRCAESGAMLASWCRPAEGMAKTPSGLLVSALCFSTDPKGCQ